MPKMTPGRILDHLNTVLREAEDAHDERDWDQLFKLALDIKSYAELLKTKALGKGLDEDMEVEKPEQLHKALAASMRKVMGVEGDEAAAFIYDRPALHKQPNRYKVALTLAGGELGNVSYWPTLEEARNAALVQGVKDRHITHTTVSY